MKDNILRSSLKLNKKQSPIDKRFNAISLICGLVSGLVWLAFFSILFYDYILGLNFFALAFFFIAILNIVGLYFSITELIRNLYFDSLLSFILLSGSFVLILTVIIAESIIFKTVYIYPNFF